MAQDNINPLNGLLVKSSDCVFGEQNCPGEVNYLPYSSFYITVTLHEQTQRVIMKIGRH